MDYLGIVLAAGGGAACGLSGALFGAAVGRLGKPGPKPSWVGPSLTSSAALGVVAAAAGVWAVAVGQPAVPFVVIGGGVGLAVASVLFRRKLRERTPPGPPSVPAARPDTWTRKGVAFCSVSNPLPAGATTADSTDRVPQARFAPFRNRARADFIRRLIIPTENIKNLPVRPCSAPRRR